MTLKKAIKEAINAHSKKFNCKKVWSFKTEENYEGDETMWIELTVTKKPKTKK